MLTVEEYGRIRIAHRDGMSIRPIARWLGYSRRKIRQVLEEAEPRPYTLQQDRPAPRLGPFKPLIEQILAEDEQAPGKQRHTGAKLYQFRRNRFGHGTGCCAHPAKFPITIDLSKPAWAVVKACRTTG